MAADHPDTRQRPDDSFASLVEAELRECRGERIHLPRDGNEFWLRNVDEDLVGMALSGGGIRSATFNLGLLQGLDRVGLLPALDYISTVSGGGYIGGFWTAWRKHDPGGADRDDVGRGGDVVPKPLFPRDPAPGSAEPGPIRHLREFSNFLSPRLGLLSADTGRMVVATVAAVLPAVMATAALVVLVLGAWATLAVAVVSGSAVLRVGALAALTLVALVLMEARLRAREQSTPDRSGRRSPLAGSLLAGAVGVAAVAGAAWLAGPAAGGAVGRSTALSSPASSLGDAFLGLALDASGPLWLVPFVWLAPAFAIIAVRALTAPLIRRFWLVEGRAAFDRVVARLFLLAGVWLALTAVWWAGAGLESLRIEWAAAYGTGTAGLAALVAWLQKRVTETLRGGGLGSRVVDRLRPRLPSLLGWVAVAALAVGMAALITYARDGGWLGVLGLGAAGLTALTLVYFDPNRIGLHAFYRGRIARTFLGASNPSTREASHRTTEEVRGDDFPMSAAGGRPLHLVCTTANELAPLDPLASLHRGGRSAALSAVGFTVDRDWRQWHRDGAQDSPTLAAALTASAAAFNPMMGSYSMRLGRAVTFLMAALNLRLGRWVKHPRERGESKNWRLPGRLFYKELLGLSRTDGGDVHLSDGGHFENMGLYELIRRHCRYMVVSDCGADPDVSFNDLATLIRRVREDFGVEVRLDLAALRPDDDGHSRQPVVVGQVIYPEGDHGTVLLFKPCLVGSEPEDITQYRRRNPVFPHESTVDQFYDAAQWESYRRLGQHAAESAFAFARGVGPWWPAPSGRDDDPAVVMHDVGRLFADARFRWLAPPPDHEERLVEVSAGARRLEEDLARPESRVLAEQVYADVREALDGLSANGDGAADGDGSGTGTGAVPTPDTLEAALPVLRSALRFFEDAHRALGLRETYTHPAHLGVVNLMGRWTRAPLFQLTWPLLRSLHAPDFARFLDTRFGLQHVLPVEGRPVALRADRVETDPGYAATAWRACRAAAVEPEREFVACETLLRYGRGGPEVRVQVGILEYRRVQTPGDGPPLAVWSVDDLFVPPGLWGVGLGGLFLRALLRRADSPIRGHRVVVAGLPGAGGFDLYRQEGFTSRHLLAGLVAEEDLRLASTRLGGTAAGTQFMVRGLSRDESRLLPGAPAGG